MKYDYRAEVLEDCREYIADNCDVYDYCSETEMFDSLYDDLFVSDCVTGKASGSYYCNTWKAEEALCHNLNLLGEALRKFGYSENQAGKYILERGAKACDVAIRCYLLGECLQKAVNEAFELRDAEDALEVEENE